MNDSSSQAEGSAAQPLLKSDGTIALIVVLSMVPPLSTDLYLPSLPALAVDLGAPQSSAGMTMTVFFVAMAFGVLVLGTVSDKFGRKPVLVACSAAATLFSAACAGTSNMDTILALRVAQGLAGGGMVALSTALVKDCFSGKRMAWVLGLTQALTLVAPMVAPLLGTLVFQLGGWRGEFVVLAVMMGIAFVGSLLLRETLPRERRADRGIGRTLAEVALFARDARYRSLVGIAALFSVVYMGYVNAASFIFIDEFGLSETLFSACFTAAALIAVLGSLLYMRLPSVAPVKATFVLLGIAVASAAWVLLFGKAGPVAFVVSVAPWLFAANFIRPLFTNVLMADAEGKAGAASSFINFCITAAGGIGMMAASSGWTDYVFSLGLVMAVIVALAIALWLATFRRVFPNSGRNGQGA